MYRDPELPNGFQDADFEQRELEAAGNRVSRQLSRMERLKADGRLKDAAEACSHSWGHGSPSLAAERENDPRAKEHGWRCYHCGSFLDRAPWTRDAIVLYPCEI
jgi:hypothetical protein